MSNDGHTGFRPGVRTAVCRKPSSLLEVVASEIARGQELPGLNSLELVELGAAYINGERSMNPIQPVKTGDEIRVHTAPRRFAPPKDLLARIVAENNDSILVEKPAGLPSEPIVDNAKENLISYLEDLRGQRFFLAHRLEPESEGLMLIAKNQEAAARISLAFSEGRVKRVYAAYVEAPVRIGEHTGAPIAILSCDEWKAETNLITEGRMTWRLAGKPLTLSYRLEIEFTKARPKEIRAYLAGCGAPIIGDRAHGSRHELTDTANGKSALAFRAVSLAVSLDH